MGIITPNLGLYKPDGTDFVDEDVDLNDNWDILDTEVDNNTDTLVDHEARLAALEGAIGGAPNVPWTAFTITCTDVTTFPGVAQDCYYIRLGKLVICTIAIGFSGCTFSATAGALFGGLPFPQKLDFNNPQLGTAYIQDAAPSLKDYPLIVLRSGGGGSTNFILYGAGGATGYSGVLNATLPFTWANGDSIGMNLMYETDAA